MISKTINGTERSAENTFYALVMSIDEKSAKNGGKYLSLLLADKEEQVRLNSFIAKTDDQIAIVRERYLNKVAEVTVTRDEKDFLKIIRLRQASDVKVSDFVTSAPIDAVEMYEYILNCLEKCDCAITQVARIVYESNKEKLLYWSAAKAMHHNYVAGLLYHVYRMMQLGERLCDVYPVDKPLLLTAIALHDIGKLEEYSVTTVGATEYTSLGSLFGHPYLGSLMVRDVINSILLEEDDSSYPADFKEKLMLLEHMIISHHGKQEYGAIVPPTTSEAYLLHMLDMIDSRYFMYEANNHGDPGTMSDPVFGLNCRVYTPKAVSEEQV